MSSTSVIKYLTDIDNYLEQYKGKQPAYLERLVSMALSYILRIGDYSADDATKIANPPYVIWNGSEKEMEKAREGQDITVYGHDLVLCVEATRRTGAGQWSKEFAPAIRHCKELCGKGNFEPSKTMILFVCTEVADDTFRSIKSCGNPGYRFVPIRTKDLARVVEIASLTLTLRQMDFMILLDNIREGLQGCESIDDFNTCLDDIIDDWKTEVMKGEMHAFLGVNSYVAMNDIRNAAVAASEIYAVLIQNKEVERYLNLIGCKLDHEKIKNGLILNGFAHFTRIPLSDEYMFRPAHRFDFRDRQMRLLRKSGAVN